MTWFTDGADIISIEMKVWDEKDFRFGLPIERDFFNVDNLHKDEGEFAYMVDNLGNMIDAALDWKYDEPSERMVLINGQIAVREQGNG